MQALQLAGQQADILGPQRHRARCEIISVLGARGIAVAAVAVGIAAAALEAPVDAGSGHGGLLGRTPLRPQVVLDRNEDGEQDADGALGVGALGVAGRLPVRRAAVDEEEAGQVADGGGDGVEVVPAGPESFIRGRVPEDLPSLSAIPSPAAPVTLHSPASGPRLSTGSAPPSWASPGPGRARPQARPGRRRGRGRRPAR